MSWTVTWSPASAQSASHVVIPRGAVMTVRRPTDRQSPHFAVVRGTLAVVDAPLYVPVISQTCVVSTALGRTAAPKRS